MRGSVSAICLALVLGYAPIDSLAAPEDEECCCILPKLEPFPPSSSQCNTNCHPLLVSVNYPYEPVNCKDSQGETVFGENGYADAACKYVDDEQSRCRTKSGTGTLPNDKFECQIDWSSGTDCNGPSAPPGCDEETYCIKCKWVDTGDAGAGVTPSVICDEGNMAVCVNQAAQQDCQ